MKISRDAIPLGYVVECKIEDIAIPGVDLDKLPLHQYLMLSPKQVIVLLDQIFALWAVSEGDQAKLLSLTANELTRWRETGKFTMTLPLSYQFRALIEIHRDLNTSCNNKEAIRHWLHTPHKAFLMRTPLTYMIATEPGFGLDRINHINRQEGTK